MRNRAQKLVSQPLALAFTLALLALALTATPALAAQETPVAKPATEVTGNSAVLHGELNPNAPGEPGGYYFKVKQSAVTCFPEATEFPEEPYDPAFGNEKEAVEVEATNLEPNQTYSYCLVEEPSSLLSTPLTFKTLPAAKPFVYKGYKGKATAIEVGTFSATLRAAVNPEEQDTTYAFEYATNEAFTGAKTIPGTSTLKPQAYFYEEVPASVSTGSVLGAGTTYYFRVVATNPTGTTTGPTEQLTTVATQEKPVVIGESLSAHNSYEPKLEASIDPNYEETSYSFEYSTKATGEVLEGTIHTLPGAPPAKPLPAFFEEFGLPTSPVGMPGLQAGTTYYYRVVANDKTSEEAGTPVYGPVQSFQADGAPAITTAATGEPAPTTVAVSGNVTPQGLPSTYHFAYIPLAAYEAAVAKGLDPFAASFGGRETYNTKLANETEESFEDYAPHPVELRLEELAPETTYVYALVAHNELGTTYAAPQTFTTAPAPPAPPAPGATEPQTTPPAPAFPGATLPPLVPYTPIAQLNANEAREGKAVNPPPKKKGKAKKRRKAKKRKRGKR